MTPARGHIRRSRLVTVLTVALVTVLATAGVAAAALTFQLKWGDHNTLDGQLRNPAAVAVDNGGNTFVADTDNDRVQKFGPSGAFITQWGTSGTGDGQFSSPRGIATDSVGSVYVADTGNNRVQKFNSTGSFLTKWGNGPGNDPSQFNTPMGLAVSSTNQVYVADRGNDRITQWSTTGGSPTLFVGSTGTGALQFINPSDVAVDATGNVFVADTGNNRISSFTSLAAAITQVGTTGTGNLQFSGPLGVAVDADSHVFVADTGNNRVQVFTTPNTFVVAWNTFTSLACGTSNFGGPKGIAVNPSTTAPDKFQLFVADTNNARIVEFLTSSPGLPGVPNCLRQFGIPNGTGNGQFLQPRGVAIDPSNGNVFVIDSGNRRVEKFNANGGFLGKWSVNGANPTGIAVDGSSRVYVTDSGDGSIFKYDDTGGYIANWGGSGSGNGLFVNGLAGGIAVSGAHVYVVDTGGNRVQVFNTSSGFELAFGSGPGTGNTQLNGPLGIALDASGNIFVTDNLNNRVVEWTAEFVGPSATFVRKWGIQPSPGSADGQFNGPGGIAADALGNVYVSDINNQRVQKFTGTGAFIEKFGTSGTGDGQFDFGTSQVSGPPLSLAGIAATSGAGTGAVYVADINNNRIQRFGNPGDFTSLPPARILDTRATPTVGLSGAFTANQTRDLTVIGVGGVPASGVGAVLINMTVAAPTAPGFLTLSPAGQAVPLASNLNFVPAQVVPNLVIVKVGTGGNVSITNGSNGTVDVIGDVVGWYSDGNALTPADKFTGFTPNRILDTRSNVGLTGAFTANQVRQLTVTGGGVPVSADAVVMNMTVTAGTQTGFLTVFPAGTTEPLASNLNWTANLTVANLVVAKIGAGGQVSIANTATALPPQPSSGTVQVIADVVGYYESNNTGARLTPITPQRLLDTRVSPGTPVAANGTITVDPSATSGLPAVGGYTAVAINTTAVAPTQAGFLTVFPSNVSAPLASNLNFVTGQTVPNLVKVKVGTDGKFKILNGSQNGTTHVVVDIVGFYTS